MRSDGVGRIDVGVAHHELFEDVVLDRAGELFRRHALLLGGDDVEREHRQHRAVHGHRHRHLVERDAGRTACACRRSSRSRRPPCRRRRRRADDRCRSRGGWRDRRRSRALLPGGEVAPVEGVAVLGGGEAGILPDGPRLRDVHGRVGPAEIRRRCRDTCRGNRGRRGRLGRRAGFTAMPSGVSQACAPVSPVAIGASAKSTSGEIRDTGHRLSSAVIAKSISGMTGSSARPPRISCAARENRERFAASEDERHAVYSEPLSSSASRCPELAWT